MSYCLNPSCPQPKNPDSVKTCQSCGSPLLLRSRYLGQRCLGQGGFGATFLTRDLILPGKPSCVIKQLRPSSTSPHILQMARELFQREAETLGRIGNHPQVPRLLDFFEENQHFYLVQEYVKGNNLQQEIKRNGPLTEAGVKQFLSEIMPMIQYIHSQQVIHRDIKPANLIRREQDKKLVLIDFGAVKNQINPEQTADSADQTAFTQFAIGTPGFAPPEQMAMRPVYASDIYAIGVTCIYLLTGKAPKDLDYNPSTGEMVWRKYVDIGDHLAQVLGKMLEVGVRHRYQKTDEVLRALDLEPYLEGLAENLVTKANPPKKGTIETFSLPNNFNRPSNTADTLPNSSSSRRITSMAEKIRARRERLKQQDTQAGKKPIGGINTTSGRMASGKLNSSGRKNLTRLDKNSLLQAYKKGRRDFTSQNLSSINLQQANLSDSRFNESRLTRANLQGADLSNTNFGKANLTNAILKDAMLSRAYFNYANLGNADLRGANLSYAHLSNANLKGANLSGADLSNAKVTEEQLAQAKTNWNTILPSGKRGFW